MKKIILLVVIFISVSMSAVVDTNLTIDEFGDYTGSSTIVITSDRFSVSFGNVLNGAILYKEDSVSYMKINYMSFVYQGGATMKVKQPSGSVITLDGVFKMIDNSLYFIPYDYDVLWGALSTKGVHKVSLSYDEDQPLGIIKRESYRFTIE